MAGVDRASALQLSLPLVTDAGATSIGIAGITEVVESLILELEIGHFDICVLEMDLDSVSYLDVACGEISLAGCCRIDNEWVLRSLENQASRREHTFLGAKSSLAVGLYLRTWSPSLGKNLINV